jgi:hypothetical protein
MGSSGGSANPMYLSQGGVPMPGLPIAGQGAPNDIPQNFGKFQEFLPEISPAGRPGYQIMPAGQGPNPSATGLTSDMFRYRSPQGNVTPSEVDSLRQQLAALQQQGGGGGGGGNGQFGAARAGTGSDVFSAIGRANAAQYASAGLDPANPWWNASSSSNVGSSW